MARVETHIQIARPVQQVFTYALDNERSWRWEVLRSEVLSHGWLRSGSTFEKKIYKGLWTENWRGHVVHLDAPKKFSYSMEHKHKWKEGTWEFLPSMHGTTILVEEEFSLHGIWKLLPALKKMFVKRRHKKNLRMLKSLLENKVL